MLSSSSGSFLASLILAVFTQGTELTVSAIARQAGVDRSFLYRHRDLHAAVLARADEPLAASPRGPAASRSSLTADLANAHERGARLSRENTQLRQRLSEHLGDQAWRASPASAPPTTSTAYTGASLSWNNTPQSNAVSWQNAKTSSTRRGPLTAILGGCSP
jgi:transposase-like protein